MNGQVLRWIYVVSLVFLAGGSPGRPTGTSHKAGGAGLLPEKSDSAEPVEKRLVYELAPQQTLRYRIDFTRYTKSYRAIDDPNGPLPVFYSVAGIIVVTVRDVQENGCSMDLRISVISAEYRGEAQDVNAEENLTVRCFLRAKGGIEFEPNEPARSFRANGLRPHHEKVFEAIDVIFPVLPDEWYGEVVKNKPHRWGYSYTCGCPLIIKGKQKTEVEPGDTMNTEVTSNFSGGVVRSGKCRLWRIINGNTVSEKMFRVSLSAEGETDRGPAKEKATILEGG